jgi:hypothetical protein
MTRKAYEYRQQAEELRAAADETDNPKNRDTLLKLADEFDRMALHPVENHPKVLRGRWS